MAALATAESECNARYLRSARIFESRARPSLFDQLLGGVGRRPTQYSAVARGGSWQVPDVQ